MLKNEEKEFSKEERNRKQEQPRRVNLNQKSEMFNLNCMHIVATNKLLYGLGAVFGARVVGVVRKTDV